MFVIAGNDIATGLELLIKIENSRHFHRDGIDLGTQKSARVVDSKVSRLPEGRNF